MSKVNDNYVSTSMFFQNPSNEEIEQYGEENAYQLKELEADKKANWLFSAGTVACVGFGFTVADIISSDDTSASEALSFFVAPLITQIIVLSRTNMVYRRIGKQLKQRMIDNKTAFDELTQENIELTGQNTALLQQVDELKVENENLINRLTKSVDSPLFTIKDDESHVPTPESDI
jgi:cell division protein FtsB